MYMYSGNLQQVAVAKRQAEAAKDVPLECRPEKQTASQSFWTALTNTFTLNTDKCAEYYEKMLVDPAYEVAPTQVKYISFIQEYVQIICITANIMLWKVQIQNDYPF